MAHANATPPAHTPDPSGDHTPWTVEPVETGFDSGFYQVSNSKGWVIATRLVYEDAHLLAVAPELLEACRQAVEALNQIPSKPLDSTNGHRNTYSVCSMLDTVIAKAEGQS